LPQITKNRAETAVEAYAGFLLAVTVALAYGVADAGTGVGAPLWGVAILAAIALLSEKQPVRISANTEITVSVLPLLFAAVVYGPLAAMVVGACGLLADLRRPYTRWIIWTCVRALAGGMAGIAAGLVLGSRTSLGALLAACIAAVLMEALIDVSLNSVTGALRGTARFFGFVRSVWPVLLATIPLYVPVVALLAYAYYEISAWSVLLFVAPAFASQNFYRLYREQREAAEQLTSANERLSRANLSFATALVTTLDARDQYTAGHSAAVAIYARDIAKRMGLSHADQELAHLSGLVHDIGKIGLPAGLLEKPGPLTLDERRQMEEHSAIGERILEKVEDYAEIAKIVRHHHERVDGHGYPDRLTHDEIPLLSRIIAVADAYNAMTSNRPYRDAMPSRVARLRLAQAVESQFDTSVVAAFEAILAGASEAYRLARRDDFALVASEFDAPAERGAEARAV